MAYVTDKNENDYIDHLIENELEQQANWLQRQKEWDARRGKMQISRRHRYLTFASNIASVVALLIVGIVIQNVTANIKASRMSGSVAPAVIQHVELGDSLNIDADSTSDAGL
ncbi:MAG: hypothetical protein J5486_05350 [Bacteroidaceae bacterium]|nr:hypothetical protein [Bacteroidaceae bacterium]